MLKSDNTAAEPGAGSERENCLHCFMVHTFPITLFSSNYNYLFSVVNGNTFNCLLIIIRPMNARTDYSWTVFMFETEWKAIVCPKAQQIIRLSYVKKYLFNQLGLQKVNLIDFNKYQVFANISKWNYCLSWNEDFSMLYTSNKKKYCWTVHIINPSFLHFDFWYTYVLIHTSIKNAIKYR